MKIGTVPYLNSLPLTHFLHDQIVKMVPSELAQALLNDQIDVALLPVYTIIKNNLRIHPDAGIIGCDGPVKSVGFFTRSYIEGLDQIRSIYMDRESLSSVYLAKIILKKFYGISLYDLEFFHHDKREMADAQLLIGDKALFFDKTRLAYKYWDIGEVWKQQTNSGFMFACWASKRPLSPAEVDLLKQSKEAGLRQINLIDLGEFNDQKSFIVDYLKQNIVYQPTPNIKKGLRLYKEYLDEYHYSSNLPKQVA